MRIRWKILILLLSITLIPMLLLRLNGYMIFMEAGNDLGQSARNSLLHRTTMEMERMVEDHAVVLARTSRLLGTVLRSERRGVEAALAGTLVSHAALLEESTVSRPRKNRDDRYCIANDYGLCTPFTVDYSKLWVRGGRGKRLQRFGLEEEEKFALLQVLRGSRHPVSDLVLWSVVRFDSGHEVVYPSAGRVWIPGHRRWVFGDVEDPDKPSWSRPYIDPVTRQVVITVFMPFDGENGKGAGLIGLVIPLDVLQHNPQHIRHMSADSKVLIARLEEQSETGTGEQGLRVLLRGDSASTVHRHWIQPEKEEWLSSSDNEQFSKMVHELAQGRSGVTAMPFRGVPSLWGYAGAGSRNSLLFIIPEKDAVADAEQAQQAIQKRFRQMGQSTGFIFLAVIFVTTVLSLVVARFVGYRLKQLVDGVRAIAKGNFGVRVDINSRDELGELARSFNEMVPALLEREKIKESLGLAMQIQQGLLPDCSPEFPGLDVAGTSRYCDETGGDYYDYFTITCDDRPRLGLAVGDVSGHGIPAALLMVSVRGYLRSRLAHPGCLGEVVTDVNRLVTQDTFGCGTFMTFLLLVVDSNSGVLHWVRAGHDPALLYDPASDSFEELKGGGLPLGVLAETRYEVAVHESLESGQILFMGTDGIWETRNPAGEMFGKERLQEVLREGRGLSARDIVTAVIKSVDAFRGDGRQDDDVTLIVLKKT